MSWLRRWGPAIVWAAVIWGFSTEIFSASATGRIIYPLLRWLLPQASPHTLHRLHSLIRKSAHVAEYFVFSLLVLRGVRGERRGWKLAWALATVAIVACYAGFDEVHQAFVPERTASPFDSLLDTSAAVMAQALVWVQAWRQAREPSQPVEVAPQRKSPPEGPAG